jgi:hypothetical protein
MTVAVASRRFAKPRLGFVAVMALLAASAGAAAQGITVSESGQANYSMPIAVPPGVGGMEPKLSLVYNSGGINGPVGVGWAVQGISQITRCGQSARDATTGKPIVRTVRLEPADDLCLDGQRLIKVTAGAPDFAGTAAADQGNPAMGGAVTEFRTETDGFSRIRASETFGSAAANGPARFVVQSKAGLLSEYGRIGAGDDQAIVSAVGGAKNGVATAWLLRRVKDTVGNAIDFHYEQTTPTWGTGPNGVAAPGREWNLIGVSYGCKADTACSNVHVVKLSYGDRADKAEAYHLGSKVVSTRLLNRIEVRVGAAPAGAGVPSGGTLVRAYKLAHQASGATSRSNLVSIAECANEATVPDNNCLPPNRFAYTGNGMAYSEVHSSIFGLQPYPLTTNDATVGVLTGDFNGDGKTDLLRWDNRSGGTMTAEHQYGNPGWLRYTNKLWLADAKTPGKFNSVAAFDEPLGKTMAAEDATNSVSFARLGGGPAGGTDPEGYVNTYASDINGDGRADLVAVCRATTTYCGTKPVRMWLSLTSSDDPTAPDYGRFREIDVPLLGPREFDANGVDLGRSVAGPLVTHGSAGRVICYQQRDGVETITNYGQRSVAQDAIWQDFDGDGRIDLLSFDVRELSHSGLCPLQTGGTSRTLRVYAGRGDGTFVQKHSLTMLAAHRYGSDRVKGGLSYMEVMDINADGRPDVLFRRNRWIQQADGSFAFVDQAMDPSPQHTDYRMLAADITGDGKTDVITLDPSATITDPKGSGRQVSANPWAARLFVNVGDGTFVRDDRPLARINALGPSWVSVFAVPGQMYYGSAVNGSIPLDINGDGLTDFLAWVGENGMQDLRLFVGKAGTDAGKTDGTVPGVSAADAAALRSGIPALNTGGRTIFSGDFMGVGAISFIVAGNNGGNSLWVRTTPPPDMLQVAVSPTGNSSTVVYSSTGMATNGASYYDNITTGVYLPSRPPLPQLAGTAALTPITNPPSATSVPQGDYPIYHAHPSQWVVSRTIQGGFGVREANAVTTAFVYRGMKVDLSGGGNLGFESVSKFFPYANGGMLITTSEYLQDPDERQYQGMTRCTFTEYNPAWKPNWSAVSDSLDDPLYDDFDRRRRFPYERTVASAVRQKAMGSSKPVNSQLSGCLGENDAKPAGNSMIAMTSYIYNDISKQSTPAGSTMNFPQAAGSLVKRPYQYKSVERKWDLNNRDLEVSRVVSTNAVMTAYGDVKLSTVATTQFDARLGTQTWTKETTNDYSEAGIDGTKWLLGRLSRSTVRSTTPTTAVPTPNSASLSAQQRATQDPALTTVPPKPPTPLTPEQLSVILQPLLDD